MNYNIWPNKQRAISPFVLSLQEAQVQSFARLAAAEKDLAATEAQMPPQPEDAALEAQHKLLAAQAQVVEAANQAKEASRQLQVVLADKERLEQQLVELQGKLQQQAAEHAGQTGVELLCGRVMVSHAQRTVVELSTK
jgi:hypothetical protein